MKRRMNEDEKKILEACVDLLGFLGIDVEEDEEHCFLMWKWKNNELCKVYAKSIDKIGFTNCAKDVGHLLKIVLSAKKFYCWNGEFDGWQTIVNIFYSCGNLEETLVKKDLLDDLGCLV